MTTTISDLPRDLVEQILSRVPLTYLSTIRSTSTRKQFLGFMIRIYEYDYDYDDDLTDPPMKKLSIPNHHQVEICDVCINCDGLLLCVIDDPLKLLVWNPYLAQTRLIQTRKKFLYTSQMHALGYNNSNIRNHKILKFYIDRKKIIIGIELYDFSSDSWRVLDVNQPYFIYNTSASLKGNAYFCGLTEDFKDYLVYFDFTTERFGPSLPLPSQPYVLNFENVTLSRVTNERLALLYDHYAAYFKINIWTTTKIEPNAVLWSKFLTLDMRPHESLVPYLHMFDFDGQSFFIDEEKKVAVFLDICVNKEETCTLLMAYIIGEDGYFRSVNMGEVRYPSWQYSGKFKCSSYVPSLVKLHV
ncbi:hypothetical protein EUTSA_v10023095mg [Eutrema salsugineum]|uniref:F-box domain-containing protein n=1 Tax=Eutrema salsugineum TaxID=72664 RepID=V4ME46_EUTSA|nr:hypothetical protein EUTSA_v10023095mg [Eutrema salsugineum]